MDGFTYPFRFSRGRAARLNVDTDAYRAQKVASVLLTQQGELPLNPDFGGVSPEFNEFDSGGTLRSIANNFADIKVVSITSVLDGNGNPAVAVQFESI